MSLFPAIAFRDSFPQSSREYRSMDCFLRHARGRNNPMSKSVWAERMEEMGCPVDVRFLERRIIRPARQIYDFFGVKRFKGLYLMIDDDDIEHSAHFYREQGDSMYCRRDILSSRVNASRRRSASQTLNQIITQPYRDLHSLAFHAAAQNTLPEPAMIE
jgi:hypothetical protein